jgi:hypothetical protein
MSKRITLSYVNHSINEKINNLREDIITELNLINEKLTLIDLDLLKEIIKDISEQKKDKPNKIKKLSGINNYSNPRYIPAKKESKKLKS